MDASGAGGLTDDQLAQRRDRLAGSWAACAMGTDPDRTLADLWHAWAGREPAIPVDAAYNGLYLEHSIARLAEHAHGWRLRRIGRTFVAGDLAATPDCYLLNEPAFVELKAYGGPLDALPARWAWQAATQLAVRPDIERVEIVALTGARLRRWTIARDAVADDIARLHARATELRAMYLAGEPPPPDPRDDASDVLTFAPLAPGEAVAHGEGLETGDALAELVRVRKVAEAGEERLRRALADVMALDALTGLRGPSWSAVARPAASGKVSLVFTVAAPIE